jgi:hypothetical protein
MVIPRSRPYGRSTDEPPELEQSEAHILAMYDGVALACNIFKAVAIMDRYVPTQILIQPGLMKHSGHGDR